MTKEEFIPYFKCFTDSEGNPVGRGNLDKAFIEAEYASFNNQVSMEAICSKWKQYIDQCIAEKTPDKFIKTMENFIKDGTYKNDYGGSLKSKQPSFLDKYPKSQPKPVIEPLKQWLIDLPEGDFSMAEGDTEEDRDKFLEFLQKNKGIFFEEYHFVIKQKDKDFIKICL